MAINSFVERLRPRSAAEQTERDLARQAAHDELARNEAEIAEVERRTGYREIEARKEAAYDAVWDAEYEVMEANRQLRRALLLCCASSPA